MHYQSLGIAYLVYRVQNTFRDAAIVALKTDGSTIHRVGDTRTGWQFESSKCLDRLLVEGLYMEAQFLKIICGENTRPAAIAEQDHAASGGLRAGRDCLKYG